jgi:hypothetical protein
LTDTALRRSESLFGSAKGFSENLYTIGSFEILVIVRDFYEAGGDFDDFGAAVPDGLDGQVSKSGP